MTEISALEKHACPACGAQAEWNAAKQKLVCPFCGTESPYVIDATSGRIDEIDLVKALREMPEELRGWQAAKKTVQCRSCKAVSVFDPERVGQRCEFCGSPALVPYEEIKSPIRPQSLLPFKVSETQVRETMRRWYASKWFAPNALKRRGLVDTIKGVYVPYWTFDARVHCPWTAEAGYHYYVTEEYRDNQGRTQTRQVQKTRWEWAQGIVDHFFDDEPVPGTHGIHMTLLRAIEPWPTAELVPYDTAYLSGHIVEHYQVVLVDAAKQSREAMTAKLRGLCAAQVPGDTHRNLQISPAWSGETFKHILAPVWLLVYTYGAKSFQVLANGYTGKIEGEYPKSFWKIAFVTLLVIVVVLFLLVLQGR
jgi:Zn finger protein HypA/HybF involved in hydrogenase expression